MSKTFWNVKRIFRLKESETTLDWRDQEVKIKWPIKKPIMSKKDKIGKNLEFFR